MEVQGEGEPLRRALPLADAPPLVEALAREVAEGEALPVGAPRLGEVPAVVEAPTPGEALPLPLPLGAPLPLAAPLPLPLPLGAPLPLAAPLPLPSPLRVGAAREGDAHALALPLPLGETLRHELPLAVAERLLLILRRLEPLAECEPLLEPPPPPAPGEGEPREEPESCGDREALPLPLPLREGSVEGETEGEPLPLPLRTGVPLAEAVTAAGVREARAVLERAPLALPLREAPPTGVGEPEGEPLCDAVAPTLFLPEGEPLCDAVAPTLRVPAAPAAVEGDAHVLGEGEPEALGEPLARSAEPEALPVEDCDGEAQGDAEGGGVALPPRAGAPPDAEAPLLALRTPLTLTPPLRLPLVEGEGERLRDAHGEAEEDARAVPLESSEGVGGATVAEAAPGEGEGGVLGVAPTLPLRPPGGDALRPALPLPVGVLLVELDALGEGDAEGLAEALLLAAPLPLTVGVADSDFDGIVLPLAHAVGARQTVGEREPLAVPHTEARPLADARGDDVGEPLPPVGVADASAPVGSGGDALVLADSPAETLGEPQPEDVGVWEREGCGEKEGEPDAESEPVPLPAAGEGEADPEPPPGDAVAQGLGEGVPRAEVLPVTETAAAERVAPPPPEALGDGDAAPLEVMEMLGSTLRETEGEPEALWKTLPVPPPEVPDRTLLRLAPGDSENEALPEGEPLAGGDDETRGLPEAQPETENVLDELRGALFVPPPKVPDRTPLRLAPGDSENEALPEGEPLARGEDETRGLPEAHIDGNGVAVVMVVSVCVGEWVLGFVVGIGEPLLRGLRVALPPTEVAEACRDAVTDADAQRDAEGVIEGEELPAGDLESEPLKLGEALTEGEGEGERLPRLALGVTVAGREPDATALPLPPPPRVLGDAHGDAVPLRVVDVLADAQLEREGLREGERLGGVEPLAAPLGEPVPESEGEREGGGEADANDVKEGECVGERLDAGEPLTLTLPLLLPLPLWQDEPPPPPPSPPEREALADVEGQPERDALPAPLREADGQRETRGDALGDALGAPRDGEAPALGDAAADAVPPSPPPPGTGGLRDAEPVPPPPLVALGDTEPLLVEDALRQGVGEVEGEAEGRGEVEALGVA